MTGMKLLSSRAVMISGLTLSTSPDHADVDDLRGEGLGVDRLHLQLAGDDQVAVLAGEPDRLAAVAVDVADDLLVDLAAEDHLHHVHGFGVGDAHALDEAGFLAHGLQNLADLRPAAVDHHRVEADVFHQDDVLGEALLEPLLDHGVAAVLDDDGLVVEALDVGQRLHQDVGFFDQLLHGMSMASGTPCGCPESGRHQGLPLRIYRIYRDKSSSLTMSARRSLHIGGVNLDALLPPLGSVEGEVLEQPLHDRVQTPGADVLGALVDRGGGPGDLVHGVLGEDQLDPLGGEQGACTGAAGRSSVRSECGRTPPRRDSPARPGWESGPAARGSGRDGLET